MDELIRTTVTPVESTDYDQWLPFWKNYQDFYEVVLSEEVTATTWKRFFDKDVPVHCAVAKQGGEILGFVHYVFHDSTWGSNKFCYLEDLYVSGAARGKLIGKQLIEFVQKEAKAQSCDRLYWHTQEKNKTAQRLYDWVAERPGVIEYRMPL